LTQAIFFLFQPLLKSCPLNLLYKMSYDVHQNHVDGKIVDRWWQATIPHK